MNKTFIISFFSIIFILSYLGVTGQQIVPGEYIIQWTSKSAALSFYKNNSVQKSAGIIQNQFILEGEKVLEHVKVDAAQAGFYEKLWKKESSVQYFQKNRKLEERVTPNDPNFFQQWQYINNGVGGVANADLDIDLAWDITTGGLTSGGDTIVICVIDEGVNLNHPDLKPNLWVNHGEIALNGIDDDDNGYIDDYQGWNIVTNNDDLSTGGSHGTPVCGIVGAKGNNGIGVSGVNWNTKIMFVNYGSATEANALASYAYVYTMRKLYNETNGQKGAFVVVTNASWGVNELFADDAPLWCEMYDLLGSVGVLNCGATANDNLDVDAVGDMPTSCPSEFLLAVTNLNRSDQKVTGAAYGKKSIDLGSYGHQTYTLSRTDYAAFGGTSGATPHVSGTVALMYAVPCVQIQNLMKSDPSGAALLVKDMLLHGTVSNNSLVNITTTEGRLNTNLAVKNMEALCESCAPPAGITIQTNADSLQVYWVNTNATGVFALRMRDTESQDWVYYQDYTKGKLISGLDFCKEYELQIGYQCGASQKFSYSKYFVSGGCCNAPKQFTQNYENGNLSLKWIHEALGDVIHSVTYTDLSGNGRDTTLWQPSLTLSGIDTCSWFNFSVATTCQKFETQAPVIENIIVTTPCGSCTSGSFCSFSKKITRDEWIDEVRFGDFINKSGINNNGYGNYLGGIVPVYTRDSTYKLHVLPGFSESPFTEEYSVYIDYDQNNIFEENEKVLSRRTSSVDGAETNVTIPSNALEGVTRMRVIMAFQNHNIPCDDSDFEYGEIEDYCIRIETTPACFFSGGIVVDSVDRQNVAVSFTPTNDALFYIVLYKKLNETDYDTLLVSDNPFLLSGLDSCQIYVLSMAADCGNVAPVFSDPVLFESPCRTSVGNVLAEEIITVTPNPSSISFRVNHLPESADVSFEIFDLYGQVFKLEFTFSEKNYNVVWPDFSVSGIYFLRILWKNQSVVKKIIKM
ncbi:MAG: S8 family peptidase [Saprospiraceae bacterium]|nr:S8 family peptidase [Saprospiraceae bacterium]